MESETKNLFDLADELKQKLIDGTASLAEKAQYSMVVDKLVSNIKSDYLPKPKRGHKAPWELTQDEIKSLSNQDLSFDYRELANDEVVHVNVGVQSSFVQDKDWYVKQNLSIKLYDDEGNLLVDAAGNPVTEPVKDNLSYAKYLRQNDIPFPDWLDVKETAFIKDYDIAAASNGPVCKSFDVVVIKDKK